MRVLCHVCHCTLWLLQSSGDAKIPTCSPARAPHKARPVPEGPKNPVNRHLPAEFPPADCTTGNAARGPFT